MCLFNLHKDTIIIIRPLHVYATPSNPHKVHWLKDLPHPSQKKKNLQASRKQENCLCIY